MNHFNRLTFDDYLKKNISLVIFVAFAALLGVVAAKKGIALPAMWIVLPPALGFITSIFLKPRIGMWVFLVYCFVVNGISRYVPGIPYGLGMDGLLVLTFLSIFFRGFRKTDWSPAKKDITILALVWFVLNILELGNPYGGSPLGWFYGMRTATLYWTLITPIGFMLIHRKEDLNIFLKIIIFLSLVGAIWGIRQFMFGVDPMEQRWLDAGAAKTHVLFGKLRVFSFYSDAGQFGASQAHVGLMALLLALGPFSMKKRIILAICGFTIIYGMLISGTRGAMFVLIMGGMVYLVLTKKVKILLIGGIIGGAAFVMLKYTSIGSGNAEVVRMRTALDPNDASFQERLRNQNILKEYLSTRPFGTGVGTIGNWGVKYNEHKYISQIPPDSLFVKVWAEYGIIGFLLWFGSQLFIHGKCCGIIWNLKDKKTKHKLMVLVAGSVGILFASYGNEVQNQMPSLVITYFTWMMTYKAAEWEAQEELKEEMESERLKINA